MNSDPLSRHYRVGGHLFVLHLPGGMFGGEELAAYAPFRTEETGDESPLFSLTVTEDENLLPGTLRQIACFDHEDGRMELYETADGGTVFLFALPGRPVCCRLYINKEYSKAAACFYGAGFEQLYGLNNCLMLLYAFATAPLDTLLMHASVVENNGQGYLFLGRSGTGKSTHSRLWLQHVEGSTLLNDDNPVVRIVDGQAVVFGTPWSGKTPCYLNRNVPLKAVVKLCQAPDNRISRLPLHAAYAGVLPACSCMKWNEDMAAGVHRTIEKLIISVPVFRLECLPDREAALLCAETIGRTDESRR